VLRSARKKLSQIRELEERRSGGAAMDRDQRLKLAAKLPIEAAVDLLENGGSLGDAMLLLSAVGRRERPAEEQGSGGPRTAAAPAAVFLFHFIFISSFVCPFLSVSLLL
jgi:hypothetical protein